MFTITTTTHSYSASDAAAVLREQVAGYTVEIERLKKRNNDLQQSQSLLELEHDQLKQEYQKLMEDNRNQVIVTLNFNVQDLELPRNA